MQRVVIVGSGASAVHFALTALEKGHHVTMLDVGNETPKTFEPPYSFNELKTHLADPVHYFLGEDYESMVYPGLKGEYYGFPPHRQFIFEQPDAMSLESSGFNPLFSFAQGGLAETWTAGVYPLNDHELADFPIRYADLEPYYSAVADRIGIAGVDDDLARFHPLHKNLMPGLRLDEHSQQMIDSYSKAKNSINGKLRTYLGRSRIATLSQDKNGRKACCYKGRCLLGCPTRSLYTPSISLDQLKTSGNFVYLPGRYVTHFKYNAQNEIQCAVAESASDKTTDEIRGDRFVLAAGTLSSSRIFMDSIYRNSGRIVQLGGLMDNRQILMPYLKLSMIGKRFNPESYQYHQLSLGIEGDRPEEYIHCQITTLKTAMVHPIIQSLPLDLRTATSIFRNLRAGLGLVNINLHDRRRPTNYLTIRPNGNGGSSQLVINYVPQADEKQRIATAMRRVKKALWKLGCIVPPGLSHVRPMGASVHYAGTIPMTERPEPLTASKTCRSHDFGNLYFADGTTFPFLPAKNLTFTLMANATRVADKEFN